MIELKQDENKRKEDELQTLNTKLWDIQKSLGDIEDERQGLTEKASRLASEKVALQRQLENREKEIMSLSRRCGTQANKMKESTKLRAANADLSRQVDQLKAALKHGEDKFWNLNVLQAKLKECQESRDDLSERLGRVKNDHDAVAENLRSCLATVNQLTEEKSEWEEERRRLLQRANFELEQQRLEHSQTTSALKQDLSSREEKIRELEVLLNDKAVFVNELQQQLTDAKERQSEFMQRASDEHGRQLSIVRSQQGENFRDLQTQYDESLAQVESQLSEQSQIVLSLEQQVSVRTQDVSVTTDALQELREQLADANELHTRSSEEHDRQLSSERTEQAAFVREIKTQFEASLAALESKLAEKSNLVTVLENQVSVRTQDMASTSNALKELQQQLGDAKQSQSTAAEEHKRLLSLLLLQQESAESEMKSQFDESIALLESKLTNKSHLVAALREAISSHTLEKSSTSSALQELQQQLTEAKESHTDAMQRAKGENERQLLSVQSERDLQVYEMKLQHEGSLAQLESQLSGLSSLVADLEEQISVHTQEVAGTSSTLEKLQKQLVEAQQSQANAFEEHESQLSSVRSQQEICIRDMTAQHQESLAQLESQLANKSRLVATLEDQVSCRTEEVSSNSTALEELRKQLYEAKESHAEAMQKANDEYERQLSIVHAEQETRLREMSALHEASQAELESKLKVKDESTVQLESKLAEKTSLIDDLRTEVSTRMQEVMTTTSALQKIQEESDMLDDITADIERLEHERYIQAESLHDRDTEIAELSAEILKLEIEKELLAQDSKKLAATKEKLSKVEEENVQTRLDHTEELTQARTTIRLLENEIRLSSASKAESIGTLQVEQAEIVSALHTKIQTLEETQELESKLHSQTLLAKDKTIAFLQEEMKDFTTHSTMDKDTQQTEIVQLRHNLQKSKTALILKDDELRDLRIIELPEHLEIIASLKKEALRLASQMESSRAESTTVISDLESQVLQLKVRSIDLEGRVSQRCRNHQAVADELNQTIAELHRDAERKALSLRSTERKLEAEIVEATALREKAKDLEKEEQDLRAECIKLRASITKVETERDSVIHALERQIMRNDSNQENNRELDGAKKELLAAEARLIQQDERAAGLEVALQERTQLLGDMVTHNKELEWKLSHLGVCLEDHDEQSSSLQHQLMEADNALEAFRESWKQKEDQYIEDMITERNLREIVEAELKVTHTKLRSSKLSDKDIAELERENEALKDKVRRQEIYLMRKLEKDKALKERTNTSTMKTPGRASTAKTPGRASAITTPAVRASALKTPATRASGMKTPAVTGRIPPRNIQYMPSLDTSIEMDLDSILGD